MNTQENTSPTKPGIWILAKWLIYSTRKVLKPLLFSALARIFDQLTGIAMFIIPMIFILNLVVGQREDCPFLEISASNWGLALVMVFLALTKGLWRYLEQYFGHLVAFKALELLRAEAYRDIHPQAPAIVFQSHSGDLLDRLTKDIDRIEVFFAHTFAPAVSAVVVPTIVIAGTFALAPWQLGVTVAVVLVLGLLIPWVGIRSGQIASRKKMSVRGELTENVTDSVNGLTEVVGYGLSESRLSQLDALGQRLHSVGIRAAHWDAFRQAFLLSWRMLGLLGMLGVGGILFSKGQLSLVVWCAVMMSVARCWEVVKAVASFGVDLNVSFAAAQRVYQLSHAGLSLPDGLEDTPKGHLELEFREVSFTYRDSHGLDGSNQKSSETSSPAVDLGETRGSRAGVNEVSLKVLPGSWTALVGATGCGKSTLARLALRFFDPDSGQVLLNGVDLRQLRLPDLRQSISLVSADAGFMNTTIADNLRLAAPLADDDALWRVLELAQLADEVRSMPEGLNYRVGEHGEALSGGQRQRLSLAQALLRESRLLILDEYTAHLNPELAWQIRENIEKLPDRPTVLEITHTLEAVRGLDWVAVADLGRIVEQGKPDDLLSDPDSVLSFLIQ